MVVVQHLAVVGHLANLPQQAHCFGMRGEVRDLGIADEVGQCPVVVCHACANEVFVVAGVPLEALQQCEAAAEIERRVAPHQGAHILEGVVLDGPHERFVHAPQCGGRTERAIVGVAAGTPGDLRELVRSEHFHLPAVELPQRREGDMVYIHVEAHADGIGGNDVLDFSCLVHGDLRVARAWRQRPEDHSTAAALAAQDFREFVDIRDGEGDDSAARWQACQFTESRVGEIGEPGPDDKTRIREKCLDGRTHGGGSHQDGFLGPPCPQEAVREHMAALRIATQLDLIDGEELHRHVKRHRFRGAHEVAGPFGNDPFLARDQRRVPHALLGDHTVVDFPCEKPQRQAYHAAPVGEHPFDGEMRLARVGRTKNGGKARFGARHAATFAVKRHDCKRSLPAACCPWRQRTGLLRQSFQGEIPYNTPDPRGR